MNYETTLAAVRRISETAHRQSSPRKLRCDPWQPFHIGTAPARSSWEDLHPPQFAHRPSGRVLKRAKKNIERRCKGCGEAYAYCICAEQSTPEAA